MKIGIFTDTYRPSVNGVVYVTEILRRNFEALGHEVYVFAPAPSLSYKNDDPHTVRFPALRGVVYEDFNSSLFFPPTVLKKIKELDLDVIHFLTPGQVGLMGVYAAHKLKKPLVAEYCTDLFEYVEHYPAALAAILALGAVMPFTLKFSAEEFFGMVRAGRPRRKAADWSREMIKHLLNILYGHCDAVIVHSRKSAEQLKSWQNGDRHYPIYVIPTGVDQLPVPTADQQAKFNKTWGLQPSDEVVLYAGRLSAEKNLDMLIDMTAELTKWRPSAKLLFVGDFDYRPVLEEKSHASPAANRIVFAGKLPREQLGLAYGAARVFAFPSVTDTQGLVLHEAALAGLPLVIVDREVSEVLHDGENGFYSNNDPIDFAAKVCKILEDDMLRAKMSRASKKIAGAFNEQHQCQQIIDVYNKIEQPTTATLHID